MLKKGTKCGGIQQIIFGTINYLFRKKLTRAFKIFFLTVYIMAKASRSQSRGRTRGSRMTHTRGRTRTQTRGRTRSQTRGRTRSQTHQ